WAFEQRIGVIPLVARREVFELQVRLGEIVFLGGAPRVVGLVLEAASAAPSTVVEAGIKVVHVGPFPSSVPLSSVLHSPLHIDHIEPAEGIALAVETTVNG